MYWQQQQFRLIHSRMIIRVFEPFLKTLWFINFYLFNYVSDFFFIRLRAHFSKQVKWWKLDERTSK